MWHIDICSPVTGMLFTWRVASVEVSDFSLFLTLDEQYRLEGLYLEVTVERR